MIVNRILHLSLILLCSTFTGCDFLESDSPPSWHMVNVNYGGLQGDANLLINGDVITIIDGGYYEEARVALLPYLKNLGIKTVNHFFISHPHQDHYEGMEAIQIGGIDIENVYYNMPAIGARDCCYSRERFEKYINAARNRGARIHDISKGFTLKYPNGTSIEVLYAHKGTTIGNNILDINDLSLIMQWTVNEHKILFTGDLNRHIGKYLSSDDRMSSDILKVPHHGASNLAPDSFFDKVSPRLGLVPSTKHIWLDKRGEQARSWFTSKNIPHCVNGINGTVVLEFSHAIMLSAERESEYCQFGSISSNPNYGN